MKQFQKRFQLRKHNSSGGSRRQNDARSDTRNDASVEATERASTSDLPSQGNDTVSTAERIQEPVSSSISGLRKGLRSSATDPLGLSVLHSPPGEKKVDIIFVHGLGGTSHLTWSKNKDLDLFWPSRFLPQEPIINQARILTFGYNASFGLGSTRTATTVLDFAKELLFEMKYAQDDSEGQLGELKLGQSPIIFVVHSMGGLIVKEAYMQGLQDPDFTAIAKSISAILFLSTPHRGTNLAETLNRILQVSIVSAPKQFISELIQNSYTLQKLNEQFRHVAGKLDIVSFYETRSTSMGLNKARVMVLERDSSVLGYPGEVSKPLDADHHGVCKFESRQDPLYVTVRNVIKTLLDKLAISPETEKATQPPILDIAEWLSLHDPPDKDFAFFRDRWTPGTCGWILEDESFTSWLESNNQRSSLLWIYGNAASGKSILSSFVIDYLIRTHRRCQYFFVRFGDQSKRSVHTLLRSLASQAASAIPNYAMRLTNLASEGVDIKNADIRSVWQALFKDGLSLVEESSPIYWVLDGVDELDVPLTLLKLLSDLGTFETPIRLILVSRRTVEISSAFQKLGKTLDVVSISMRGHVADLRRFIDEEMDDVADDDIHQQKIASLVLERAEGNFLWVHLAVQQVNSCVSQRDVEHALEALHPGMEALYDRMASMVVGNPVESARLLASDIIAWTTCARRLMTLSELSGALGDDAPLDLQRAIGNLCGGFVVVDIDGNVALIHQTAREYLFRQPDDAFGVRKQSANESLFLRCMNCLMEPDLKVKIIRDREPDFLDYAASSWFFHVGLGYSTSSMVLQTILRFLKGSYVLTWIHIVAKSGKLHTLILASQYMTRFLTKLTRGSLDPHQRDELAEGHNTIEKWTKDLVKLVGKFGRSLLTYPQAIYKMIAPFCPHESIIYEQFAAREATAICVTGISNTSWDDCLGRITLDQGAFSSSIQAAGSRIAILTLAGRSSTISIHNASTYDEVCRIKWSERVLKMYMNRTGTVLVTYGYLTTKIWELATGACIKTVENPESRPWPLTFLFKDRDQTLLVGCDDRRVRCLLDNSSQWEVIACFDEQQQEGTIVNSPTCMALSPGGNFIALGYRGHPLTLWNVDNPRLVAQCTRNLGDGLGTSASESWGEVTQLRWHPDSGKILGLYLEGRLFMWDPFEETTKEIMTGGNKLTLSHDGALCATGDAKGTIKVFHTEDFSLLYHLCHEDPVLDLSFSVDSRRIYDIRGTYASIWEPSSLVRFIGSPDLLENSSDAASTSETLFKAYTTSECSFGKVDAITAIGAERRGSLYCYGTDDGAVYLCDKDQGAIKQLQKSTSFMSIEQIAFSDDGKLVAFTDTSGKLVLFNIQSSARDSTQYTFTVALEKLGAVKGGVSTQLLFYPESDKLAVFTSRTVCSISVNGDVLGETTSPVGVSCLSWACHPTKKDCLLGFGDESLHIYDWGSLKEITSMDYDMSPQMTKTTPSTKKQHEHWGTRSIIVRPLLIVDRSRFLLEICKLLPGAPKDIIHFTLDIASIDAFMEEMVSLQDRNPGTSLSRLGPVHLNCEQEIVHSLCFLPRGRLLYLSRDSWLSICRLRATTDISRRRSDNTTNGQINSHLQEVRRLYSLPCDWVSVENEALCKVFSDGTLLYPRNGEVAVIKSDLFRQVSF